MSKVLAYFIGGSHDLEKRWIEERFHHIDMPELFADMPYVTAVDIDGRPTNIICKVERYQRVARLRNRKGYVYECTNE